jgi:hypothetical protein
MRAWAGPGWKRPLWALTDRIQSNEGGAQLKNLEAETLRAASLRQVERDGPLPCDCSRPSHGAW